MNLQIILYLYMQKTCDRTNNSASCKGWLSEIAHFRFCYSMVDVLKFQTLVAKTNSTDPDQTASEEAV